jgi:hypothetical protein
MSKSDRPSVRSPATLVAPTQPKRDGRARGNAVPFVGPDDHSSPDGNATNAERIRLALAHSSSTHLASHTSQVQTCYASGTQKQVTHVRGKASSDKRVRRGRRVFITSCTQTQWSSLGSVHRGTGKRPRRHARYAMRRGKRFTGTSQGIRAAPGLKGFDLERTRKGTFWIVTEL